MRALRGIWQMVLFVWFMFPLLTIHLPLVPLAFLHALVVSAATRHPFWVVQPFRYVNRFMDTRRYRSYDESLPDVLTPRDRENPVVPALLMYSDVTPGGLLTILLGAGFRLVRQENPEWRVEWNPAEPGLGPLVRTVVAAAAVWPLWLALIPAAFLPAG